MLDCGTPGEEGGVAPARLAAAIAGAYRLNSLILKSPSMFHDSPHTCPWPQPLMENCSKNSGGSGVPPRLITASRISCSTFAQLWATARLLPDKYVSIRALILACMASDV